MPNFCCICGCGGAGQPLMLDRGSGSAFCPAHTGTFDAMREVEDVRPCPHCAFRFSRVYSLFLKSASPVCPACQGSLKQFALPRDSPKSSMHITGRLVEIARSISSVEEIKSYAEAVVQQLGPTSKINFGYNGPSCDFIEMYLLAFWDSEKDAFMKDYSLEYPAPDSDLVKGVGSFLGECLVQNEGSEWLKHEPNDSL